MCLFSCHESADLKQNQLDLGSQEDKPTHASGEGLKFTCVQPIYIHEYRGTSAFQIVYTITFSDQPPAKRKYKTILIYVTLITRDIQ